MKHGDKVKKLSRTAEHRKALLANLACSLIKYKRIKTSVAKAKALRQYIEPVITKAKLVLKDDGADKTVKMNAYRYAFKKLRNKEAVKILFRDVISVIGDRPGGYTRILKIGHRLSDNTKMCYIEFVDFNTTYKIKQQETKKKRTRRGGKGKKQVQPEQEQQNTQQ